MNRTTAPSDANRVLDGLLRHVIADVLIVDRQWQIIRLSDSLKNRWRVSDFRPNEPWEMFLSRSSMARSVLEGLPDLVETMLAASPSELSLTDRIQLPNRCIIKRSVTSLADGHGDPTWLIQLHESKSVLVDAETGTDQRERSDQLLRESETRLKLALRSARMGVFDWNLVTGEIKLTDLERELLDLRPDEKLTIEHFQSRVHPEDRSEVKDAIRHSIATLRDYQASYRIVRPNGQTRHLAVEASVFAGSDGSADRMIGVHWDITREVNHERFLRRVLDTLFTFAGVCTPDGVLIQANRAALEVIQTSPEDVLGRPFDQAPWWDYCPKVQQQIRDAIAHAAAGHTSRFDVAIRTIGDQRLNIDFQIVPMRNEEGKVTHLIPSAIDISERTRYEQELLQSREKAETASRAKSEFLANMSHEIRTPMTAILGYAELLGEQHSDPKTIELIRTIRENGDHLLQLIDDILDLSKIEGGKIELANRFIAPEELIQQVCLMMRGRAIEKGLELETSFSQSMPAKVRTDPLRVRQILVNLVSNAIKFTAKGKVSIDVDFVTENKQAPVQSMVISVTDTGIGIAPEDQERVFQPFTQADNSDTRTAEGTGLGLTIGRRLAEYLRGVITLESRRGIGSTFRLALPIEKWVAHHRDDEARIAVGLSDVDDEDDPCEQDLPSISGRILVVDDRREIRFLASRFIEMAGAEPVSVASGASALTEVTQRAQRGEPISLILTDIQMPEMDGYELIQTLRHNGFERPIIALTAHAMPDDMQRCYESGCDDVASKPLDKAKLIRLLAKHLQTESRGDDIDSDDTP